MIVLSHLMNLYQSYRRFSISELITATTVSNILVFVISGALCFWFRAFALPRSVFLLWFSFNLIFQLLIRLFVWKMETGHNGTQKILIVGETEGEARRVEAQIRFDSHHRTASIQHIISPYPVRWKEVLKGATTVVVGACVDKQVFQKVREYALDEGKHVHLVPGSADLLAMTSMVDTIGDILTFSYRPLQISKISLFFKRTIDISGSLVLLIVFSLPILLLLVLIPLTSKGPSLFKQKRIGLDGKVFKVYKFRSMVVDAERTTGAVLAQYRDPRVTKLGRFIRSTRLDELPQIFNVIKGDMGLVGPRPERPEFVQQFEPRISGYSQRHYVRPGITGFAQIKAKYATDAEDKLRYDLWYIRNYNPLLDIKILLQTVLVVLRPSKAKGVDSTVSDSNTVKV